MLSLEETLDRLNDDNLYWKVRRFWEYLRLNFAPRVLWHRFCRTCSIIRVYWSTDDCDWESIVILMRHQIRRTRLHIQKHDFATKTDRVCREMLVAEHLLTRMIDDVYADIANKRYPKHGKYWAQMWNSIEKQDQEMLCRILQKHLKGWWD